ncbi:uncharacterized protein LOC135837693 [Planococcus citri]|uniref:uncharacterized protein LOC135837693 n=1 Tax=Planococcus citri TaxID=170843 RepID=UPI0031FA1312
MTETTSNVYDLTFPSPITLEKISSIVVAVELWRKEICAQLESKRSHELDFRNNIQLRTILPNLPSTIRSSLEEYIDTFRNSIVRWQKYHYPNVFDGSGSMDVLSRFDDFAWDWDGTIHEVRTAKRMILCDLITEDEKFKIACLYCFEDDIKQIWQSPFVSETMKDLNKIDFYTCPQQYYWICYLRNELHRIPNLYNVPIDELMIDTLNDYRTHSSMMYFWNRLPSDCQLRVDICYHAIVVFARFILPKLNEHQMDIFVAAHGYDLILHLLKYEPRLVHVLPTWMCIRSRMDTGQFRFFIYSTISMTEGEHLHSQSMTNVFSEIWESVPQHFKRSALDLVLHCDQLFCFRNRFRRSCSRGVKFLIVVLQDAAFEERNIFWLERWQNLIFCAPVEDLVDIMKLSFRNENEITLFKENVMSIYENIAQGCALLLKRGMFEELNEFLFVCCLDERNRMDMKPRLLRSNYVGENSVLTIDVVRNNKLLNEFIDDVFQNDADFGVEFRNQLRSSPVTQKCLLECIQWGGELVHLNHLMEFVDTFHPDEQDAVPMKKRLFEHFKEYLIDGRILRFNGDQLEAFLFWLLGSADEVIKFKQSVPVEDIFRTMIRTHSQPRRMAGDDGNEFKLKFPARLDRFLMWYFNKDEEEIEKFTRLFPDELKSFGPRKRRRTA